MLFFGVNGLGVVPAKQFGPSLMPSATSYKAPTTTDTPTVVATQPAITATQPTAVISYADPAQGQRNPDSSSTPDTLVATSPTDPVYGTGTYSPSSGFYPPPSTSTPPTTSPTDPVYGTGTSVSDPSTIRTNPPPPSTSPPPVDSYPPPTCPAGTSYDSSSHTCIGYGAGPYGAVAPEPTTSVVNNYMTPAAGPNVIVQAQQSTGGTGADMDPDDAIYAYVRKRKKHILFWLGIGVAVLGAVAIVRS